MAGDGAAAIDQGVFMATTIGGRRIGRAARSETVTVRLDPKLRYLAELAARKQRRTLSSFVEWAIEHALNDVELIDTLGHGVSIGSQAEALWDVDEADRFADLALRYPDMLNHVEQVVWKTLREYGYFWRGNYAPPDYRWTWSVGPKTLLRDRLRDQWSTLRQIARGEKDLSALPAYQEIDNIAAVTKNQGGIEDDDVPF